MEGEKVLIGEFIDKDGKRYRFEYEDEEEYKNILARLIEEQNKNMDYERKNMEGEKVKIGIFIDKDGKRHQFEYEDEEEYKDMLAELIEEQNENMDYEEE